MLSIPVLDTSRPNNSLPLSIFQKYRKHIRVMAAIFNFFCQFRTLSPWQLRSRLLAILMRCSPYWIQVGLLIPTQSTVLPAPTRHRQHACIKMRTALPANTKTRPNVVSMLVQCRWRWADIETALGQMLAFVGLHTGVRLPPPLRHHNILASRSGYF